MGLYFRKSINLGGGVRLNFSKKGVGISVGVKGARISKGPNGTYMNLSIPGTGIGYRKRLSGSNSTYSTSSSFSTRYPYQRTIVNDYTGEIRTVRAATQWELDEQIRNEELRMKNNELRARINTDINSQKEKAEALTRQVKEIQDSFRKIISSTISVDDRLNWDEQYIRESYPEFSFGEPKPVRKKIGFLGRLLGEKDDYEERIKAYEERKVKALQEYLAAKEEFEAEKRVHNADVDFLKESFEMCEESAIEKYASIVLVNSKYPPELDMDYDVDYVIMKKTLYVSFLLPNMEDLPFIDRYVYDQSTNEIREYPLAKAKATRLYEDTILAVGIRTIHELFEAIYNGAVERVVFRGYLLEDEISEETIDFSDNVRKIFEIKADKRTFESLNIWDDNICDTLKELEFTRVKDFSNPHERL